MYKDGTTTYYERYPENTITRKAISELIQKFQCTGSVGNEHMFCCSHTDEIIEVEILAQFLIMSKNQQGQLCVSMTTRWVVKKALKKHKFHPYKITLLLSQKNLIL